MTPHLRTIRIAAVDLNGRLRGKRVPAQEASKLGQGSVRMPLSALNVDITGADIENSPLVFESGDADGVLRPTGRGPVPMPWLGTPTMLYPMWMYRDDGKAFTGDPRHALASVLERYEARGWQVIAALELEFYLSVFQNGEIMPPRVPTSGRRLRTPEILSLSELDDFDAFFSALYDACDDMGIDTQTSIAESGVGQFEINLTHTDAMRAADDATLFKHMVKGVARAHGMTATFMAKPYSDQPGNGAHVHFSVLDPEGNNIFDNGGPEGSALLLNAIAGCLDGLRETSLLFMPHGPSYDRLAPGNHAPTGIGWGYENRTAAVRIPGGSSKARRIEHRVAGGDTCPYLMLAGILGAAMAGIEDGSTPPEPLRGNHYEADLPQIPTDWITAIDRFETSPFAKRIFDPLLIENMVLTKRQEVEVLAEADEAEILGLYIERA